MAILEWEYFLSGGIFWLKWLLLIYLCLLLYFNPFIRRKGEPPILISFIPWVGHSYNLTYSSNEFFARAAAFKGRVFTICMAGRRATLITDPRALKGLNATPALSFNPVIEAVRTSAQGLSRKDYDKIDAKTRRSIEVSNLSGEPLKLLVRKAAQSFSQAPNTRAYLAQITQSPIIPHLPIFTPLARSPSPQQINTNKSTNDNSTNDNSTNDNSTNDNSTDNSTNDNSTNNSPYNNSTNNSTNNNSTNNSPNNNSTNNSPNTTCPPNDNSTDNNSVRMIEGKLYTKLDLKELCYRMQFDILSQCFIGDGLEGCYSSYATCREYFEYAILNPILSRIFLRPYFTALSRMRDGILRAASRTSPMESAIVEQNTANSNKIDGNSNKIDDNSNKIDDNSNKMDANSNKIDDNSNKIDDNSNKIDENSNKIDENCTKNKEFCTKNNENGWGVEEAPLFSMAFRKRYLYHKEVGVSDSLFVAVYDALFTGIAMSAPVTFWLLGRILSEPGLRGRVVCEIDEVLGGRSIEEVELDDLNNMLLLDSTLKEVMRYYQTAPIVRVATEDCVLPVEEKSFSIRKGDWVMMFPRFAMHWNPELYRSPQIFDPDRFLKRDELTSKPLLSILAPYGIGRHVCPGRLIGAAVSKLCVIYTLKHIQFQTEGASLPLPRIRATEGTPSPLSPFALYASHL